MKRNQYKVVSGNGTYAVVFKNRGIEYDNLESEEMAQAICGVLNDGIGPEWDVVEDELKRRKLIEA